VFKLKKKAICLISGGLDSCVASFIAAQEKYQIYGLTVEYGQRHDKELRYAIELGKILKVIDHKFITVDLNKFGGSSLLDSRLDIEVDSDLDDIGTDIPSTYVPARNTVFLSIALAYAEVVCADAIFIGATSADYSGYPDCRSDFFKAFQNLAGFATKMGVKGKTLQIRTPLIDLSKADIIKKGVSIGAPLGKTWSCYLGLEKACGRCESCLLRLKGFKEAGLSDPQVYEHYPEWY
jgi:7-cyano-7-deazaguanine synthase